jgi:hypothetical protein
LARLVRLAARFSGGANLPANLPANLHALLPANLRLVENPRNSLEGDRFFLQNVAISPKRTSFREGDKKIQGSGMRGQGTEKYPTRVSVAQKGKSGERKV